MTGVRIGVARDAAFCFYYPDNLEMLEAAGAQLVFFSPLTENRLPEGLDGLYFGGGYPELHAGALAGNRLLRQEIRQLSRMNMPIYGECGGFMYLCREMGDTDGNAFSMTGSCPLPRACWNDSRHWDTGKSPSRWQRCWDRPGRSCGGMNFIIPPSPVRLSICPVSTG